MRVAEDSYRHAIALNANTHYKAYNNLASLLHRQGASRGKGNEQAASSEHEDNCKAIVFHLIILLSSTSQLAAHYWPPLSKEAEST